MRRRWNGAIFGTRTLWVAAAVLAATWNLGIPVPLSLQEEPDRTTRASQEMDLATARRDVEMQTALAKAGAEANQLKKTADAGAADLRKSLPQERDLASKLEQGLAAARGVVEAQTARAAELKRAAERGTDLQKSLERERDRAEALARELSATPRNVETKSALATEANAEASRLKQVADSDSAELINTQSEVAAAKPIAAEQAAVADARAARSQTPRMLRKSQCCWRARLCCSGGDDIGSGRMMLQRAETGQPTSLTRRSFPARLNPSLVFASNDHDHLESVITIPRMRRTNRQVNMSS